MNRRTFLQGFVATAAGILVPQATAAEPERHIWALDRTMVRTDSPVFSWPPVLGLDENGLPTDDPRNVVMMHGAFDIVVEGRDVHYTYDVRYLGRRSESGDPQITRLPSGSRKFLWQGVYSQ